MTDTPFTPKLWTPRSVDETKEVYAQWADTYEEDVQALAYATPARIAAALREVGAPDGPILDFGCGTGLSGLALRQAGFGPVDGTDISPEMLARAETKTHDGAPLYRTLTLGAPGQLSAHPWDYKVVVATGVVSLGAAPPETLDMLLEALEPGGLLAFSYNDPTLDAPAYLDALDRALQNGAEQLFREHGPHLSEKVTGADVIVLRRT
ncbi:MAG: methyltransferase domain-containing protein [Pseudomonadota bacterium]